MHIITSYIELLIHDQDSRQCLFLGEQNRTEDGDEEAPYTYSRDEEGKHVVCQSLSSD